MGGFLGIGRGEDQRKADDEATFAKQERDRAENDRKVRRAEKIAKKGQRIANVKLGGDKEANNTGDTPNGDLSAGAKSATKATATTSNPQTEAFRRLLGHSAGKQVGGKWGSMFSALNKKLGL